MAPRLMVKMLHYLVKECMKCCYSSVEILISYSEFTLSSSYICSTNCALNKPRPQEHCNNLCLDPNVTDQRMWESPSAYPTEEESMCRTRARVKMCPRQNTTRLCMRGVKPKQIRQIKERAEEIWLKTHLVEC